MNTLRHRNHARGTWREGDTRKWCRVCRLLVSLSPYLLLFAVTLVTASSVLAQEPETDLPPPPPIREPRFGAVQTYSAPEVADAAGAAWTRVFFRWPQLQLQGIHDWNPDYFPDGVLNREVDSGRELVGILIGTPAWAGDGSTRSPPRGLYLPHDDPENLWGQFVYRIVSRYKGRIDRWIIWNEPDIWQIEHAGATWAGSIDDFVQLQKVAYQAANSANPDVKIHLAATTYWWDVEHDRPQYLGRMLDTIVAHPDAPANNYFFDVASMHVYFTPQDVWNITHVFREMLDERGLQNKALWINETNAPPSSDPQHPAPTLRFSISLQQQSNYVVQAWALGLAAGAERIALYKTKDEPWLAEGVEPYGMARKDGSLRPVFWTYRVVVTYLGNFQDATLAGNGAIRRVVVPRGALGTTQVVWNATTSQRTATVPAFSDRALLVDPLGPVGEITPQNGSYRLTLEPAQPPTGGTPYLIVEGAGMEHRLARPDGMSATEQPTQPPPPTDTPAVTVTPSPARTPTATATLAPASPTATQTPASTVADTPTRTPSASPTATSTPTATATGTATATPSPTMLPTATPIPSSTATATPPSLVSQVVGSSSNILMMLLLGGAGVGLVLLGLRRFNT